MSAEIEDLDQIITTTLEPLQKNTMLETAESLLVTHVDPVGDSRVTTVLRDQIKIWLAAHFCAVAQRQIKEESADGVRTVFDGKMGMGLNLTVYGQQVKMLDPTGMLAKVGAENRKKLRYHLSTPRDSHDEP